MNFLLCDGVWSLGVNGESICNGSSISVTHEELRAELSPSLSPDEFAELKDATIFLFVLVFGFLVIKKVL